MGNSIFRLPLSAAQPPFRLPHAPLSHPRRNRPDSPHLPTRTGLRRHPYPRAPLPAAAKCLHRHVAQRTQLLPPARYTAPILPTAHGKSATCLSTNAATSGNTASVTPSAAAAFGLRCKAATSPTAPTATNTCSPAGTIWRSSTWSNKRKSSPIFSRKSCNTNTKMPRSNGCCNGFCATLLMPACCRAG